MLDDLDLHGEKPEQPRLKPYSFSLDTLNLEQELADQYAQAKTLYGSIDSDPDTPANQKAQVLNTLTAILLAIKKSLEDVHNIARVRALEEALIKTLKSLPEEAQTDFFKAYEQNLAQISP